MIKPNMPKLASVLLMGSLLTLSACGEQDKAAPAAQADDTPVVATVNGQAIHQSTLAGYAEGNQLNIDDSDQRREMIDELVMRELVMQDAIAKGLDSDPAILDEVRRTREKLILNAVLEGVIKAAPINDESLQAEYDKQVQQFQGTELKARHILVEDEEKAKSLITELDGGADFAELAKQHSTGPSGPNGGDLGWFTAETMVPPFAAAAQAMEKGSYSKEPVQTRFGWHVILLEDSRPLTPPPLEEVKMNLIQRLQQKYIKEYLDGLKSGAEIVIK